MKMLQMLISLGMLSSCNRLNFRSVLPILDLQLSVAITQTWTTFLLILLGLPVMHVCLEKHA